MNLVAVVMQCHNESRGRAAQDIELERLVVFLVEGDVTSVFETAAGENDVEVCGIV